MNSRARASGSADGRQGSALAAVRAAGAVAGCLGLAWLVHGNGLWGPTAVALVLAGGLLAAAAGARAMLRRWAERRRLHGRSLAELDRMSGDAFAAWVMRSLARNGYRCQGLPRSHDYGIDVIATRAGRRIGVQAKRYDAPVGNGAVQQAIAGAGHHACAVAAVVTQSRFTAAARAQAAAAMLPVVLVGRGELVHLGRALRRAQA